MNSRGITRLFYINKVLLYIILFLAILFSVSFMCSFLVKCWSDKTPRSLFLLFVFIVIDYRQRGISALLRGLWKNENLVFSTFEDSLFAVSQSLMFTSSLFTTVKWCLMSWCLKKRLMSMANIIGSNERDAFGRSLTYTWNRSFHSIYMKNYDHNLVPWTI